MCSLRKTDAIQFKKILNRFAEAYEDRDFKKCQSLNIEDFNRLEFVDLDISKFKDLKRNCSIIECFKTDSLINTTPYEFEIEKNIFNCKTFKEKRGEDTLDCVFDCTKINDKFLNDLSWSQRIEAFKKYAPDYNCVTIQTLSASDINTILKNRPTCVIYFKTIGFGIGTAYKYNGALKKANKRKVGATDDDDDDEDTDERPSSKKN
jgi:hypothetical protein